jgi:RNA polymerase sigma factor (sigma-70 family)
MTLVREYAQSNSEQAFSTLVSRHVNLVYSVALRQVRDPHLAEEITQSVFIILARKAKSLSPKTILSGWLCRTAVYISADALKIQRRRQFREQESQMQSILADSDSAAWNQIAPLLHEALTCLGEKEHDAVVLRFFDGKELRQVGAAMGIGEDAARMRVNRGIEKLREFFAKRGVPLSAAAIAGAVSANSVLAAPAELATAVTAAVLSGSPIITTAAAALAATKTTAMTTLQKSIIAAVFVAIAGGGIYEARQAVRLRGQVRTLQEQQGHLEQIQELQAERDSATNRLSSMVADIAKSNTNNSELLRLRGELGPLKQRLTELSNQVARTPNAWGILPEEMPPVISSTVVETARSYARLTKKLATGELSAAEQFNLLKAWPYLGRRFSEPDAFGFFQAEYLASILDLKDEDVKWQLRRILEQARNEEHAHGLRVVRSYDEKIENPSVPQNIQRIRDQWNELNQATAQQIAQILPDEQRLKFSVTWPVLDFDPRLKSDSKVLLADPRFQNLDRKEVFKAFFPPNPRVRYVPATVSQKQ